MAFFLHVHLHHLVKSLSYDIYAMEQKQGMTTAQEKRNSDPERFALLLAAFHKAGNISSTYRSARGAKEKQFGQRYHKEPVIEEINDPDDDSGSRGA